jgi:preprotein translocase subunit SecE
VYHVWLINRHAIDMTSLGQFFAFFPMVISEYVPVIYPGVQSFLKMTIIDVRDVTWFSKHF